MSFHKCCIETRVRVCELTGGASNVRAYQMVWHNMDTDEILMTEGPWIPMLNYAISIYQGKEERVLRCDELPSFWRSTGDAVLSFGARIFLSGVWNLREQRHIHFQ